MTTLQVGNPCSWTCCRSVGPCADLMILQDRRDMRDRLRERIASRANDEEDDGAGAGSCASAWRRDAAGTAFSLPEFSGTRTKLFSYSFADGFAVISPGAHRPKQRCDMKKALLMAAGLMLISLPALSQSSTDTEDRGRSYDRRGRDIEELLRGIGDEPSGSRLRRGAAFLLRNGDQTWLSGVTRRIT